MKKKLLCLITLSLLWAGSTYTADVPEVIAKVLDDVCHKEGVEPDDAIERMSGTKSNKTLLEFWDDKPIYLKTQTGTFRMPVHTGMNDIKDLKTKMIGALSQHFKLVMHKEAYSSCIPPYVRGPIYELQKK